MNPAQSRPSLVVVHAPHYPRDRVEEHLDEASFLSAHWEAAQRYAASPLVHYVDGLDERFLAHVEALGRARPEFLTSSLEAALQGSVGEGMVLSLGLAGLAAEPEQAVAALGAAFESHPEHSAELARAFELSWANLGPALRARRE